MTNSGVDEFAVVDSKMDHFSYLDILKEDINKSDTEFMTQDLRKIFGLLSARQRSKPYDVNCKALAPLSDFKISTFTTPVTRLTCLENNMPDQHVWRIMKSKLRNETLTNNEFLQNVLKKL